MGNDVAPRQRRPQAVDAWRRRSAPTSSCSTSACRKLNGYEACRRIREQPWGTGVVLIALTGWGQDEDRRRSKEAGFDHHLVKPVDPLVLEKLLSDLK